MLKKSKIAALLTVSVMMFAAVEPAFACGNRTDSRGGDAAAYGTGAGAVAAGVAAAAPVAAPYVAGVVASSWAAATVGKEFLKSTAQNAVDEFKKHPIKFAMGSYSAVQRVVSLPQIMEKFNSPKLKKKLHHLEDLTKEGKKVTVLEVKQITPNRLAIKYTVNGVEYSETIDDK